MTPMKLALLLSSSWHPRKLFLSGEVGTIQNPSVLGSMYQDGGTTAAATGSALGLVLDERYWQDRGTQKVSNGDFSAGTTGWTTVAATQQVIGSEMEVTSSGAGARSIQAVTVESGRFYEVSGTTRNGTVAPILRFGTTSGGSEYANLTTAGDKRAIVYTTGTTMYVSLVPTIAGTAFYSRISIKEVQGGHAVQSTPGSRPILRAGGKIDYDGVDDSLVITFPSDMGANCTVGRSVPNGEASILTSQTITTTYTDSTDHCGLVIINRALTATETNQLRRWLNRRAG